MNWDWLITDGLLVVAGVFLIVHLATDARRMVQVLRYQRHVKYHSLDPCPRCEMVGAGVKEAWWEIITIVALVGHVITTGEAAEWLSWAKAAII